jgi:N-acetylglucosamine kinase-like BadF-type ATPase
VPYYLGIDGGGSKTTCAVGDATSLLATGTAGPSNVVRVGEARARESLQQAVRQSCAVAGITPQQIERVCIGAAGAGRPEISKLVRGILAEILSGEMLGQIIYGHIQVVGDAQIALEAAFGSGAGVIVIAGTGSIACGRDREGRTARAGGWGFAISDEGSAHWIGRAALSAALRSIDRGDDQNAGPVAALLRELMKVWNLGSREDLVRAANFNGEDIPGCTPEFAAFFPVVLAAAGAGDALAQRVLTTAAGELAQLAAIVVHRLFPERQSSDSAAVPMAMAGGVFRHAAMVRELFYNDVRKQHPHVVLNSAVVEPVHGALQMARSAAS